MWNEPNEAALLKRWFEHMREVGFLPCLPLKAVLDATLSAQALLNLTPFYHSNIAGICTNIAVMFTSQLPWVVTKLIAKTGSEAHLDVRLAWQTIP